MELAIRNGKKGKKNTSTNITVKAVNSQNRSPNKKSKKQKGARARISRPRQMSLKARFEEFLLTSDLAGPMRIPRVGGATRTGLGMDRTRIDILAPSGSPPTIVQGFQARSVFDGDVGRMYTATNETNALTLGVTKTPGVQFPAVAQMADVNCTSITILISYLGPPLTVDGELIIGSTLALGGTASYSSLYYYPGVIHLPLASLINKPIRIAGRPLSAVAQEFVPTDAGNSDWDLPFLMVNTTSTTCHVRLEVTRTWEYRSTTNTPNEVPYERTSDSHQKDVNAYQDAVADIGSAASTMTEGLTEYAREAFLGYVGSRAGAVVGPSAMSMISYLANRNLQILGGGVPGFGRRGASIL